MGRLIQIASSTLLSGGILGNGSIGSYISNSARLAMGMGLAELQDGQVHYFSKHHVWGIERSGFFNGREKWAKGFENQRV